MKGLIDKLFLIINIPKRKQIHIIYSYSFDMKLFKFLKNKQKFETCKHKGFNQFSLLRTRGAKTYSSYAVSCN